jgi:uncharacterized membrane protein
MAASPRENELAVSSFGAILAITIGWFLIVLPYAQHYLNRLLEREAEREERRRMGVASEPPVA